MNPRQVELALKKQRLQFKSAALRDEIATHAAVVAPLFTAADKVRAGARWLRRNPEVTVGAAAALLVARPRVLFKWVRRAAVAWQAWRRARTWVEALGRRA